MAHSRFERMSLHYMVDSVLFCLFSDVISLLSIVFITILNEQSLKSKKIDMEIFFNHFIFFMAALQVLLYESFFSFNIENHTFNCQSKKK